MSNAESEQNFLFVYKKKQNSKTHPEIRALPVLILAFCCPVIHCPAVLCRTTLFNKMSFIPDEFFSINNYIKTDMSQEGKLFLCQIVSAEPGTDDNVLHWQCNVRSCIQLLMSTDVTPPEQYFFGVPKSTWVDIQMSK